MQYSCNNRREPRARDRCIGWYSPTRWLAERWFVSFRGGSKNQFWTPVFFPLDSTLGTEPLIFFLGFNPGDWTPDIFRWFSPVQFWFRSLAKSEQFLLVWTQQKRPRLGQPGSTTEKFDKIQPAGLNPGHFLGIQPRRKQQQNEKH